MGVGPALQQIGLCPAAFRTREPIRPTPLRQKERATRFVGKPTLEIEKGGVSPGHATGLCRDRSPYASETWDNGISLATTVMPDLASMVTSLTAAGVYGFFSLPAGGRMIARLTDAVA